MYSKIQIGFTFLVPAYPGTPRKRAVKQVCVCVMYRRTKKPLVVVEKPRFQWQMDSEKI